MARAAEDVRAAKVDIRQLFAQDGDRAWTIRDVQDMLSQWRGTIVYLALLEMIRDEEIMMGDDLVIRIIGLRAL